MRPPPFATVQLTLVRQPFDVLFELKRDGFSALAQIWDGRCELVSRKRNAYKSFQPLRDSLAKLKVKNAVLDGEVVCLDQEGRIIFNEFLHRRGTPTFYVFDLLYLNRRDLRQLPLVSRKLKLRQLIGSSGLVDVICGKFVEGRGVDLFQEVWSRNLEGVVAKRKTGTYATISGWLKIKNLAYTQSQRRHKLFESLKGGAKTKLPNIPPAPKKPPLRAVPLHSRRKTAGRSVGTHQKSLVSAALHQLLQTTSA